MLVFWFLSLFKVIFLSLSEIHLLARSCAGSRCEKCKLCPLSQCCRWCIVATGLSVPLARHWKKTDFHQLNNQKAVGAIRGNTILLRECSRSKTQKAAESALFSEFSLHQAVYLRIKVAHLCERFRIIQTKRVYTQRPFWLFFPDILSAVNKFYDFREP